jgi:site-specific DNA-methyltransferase (adenine-specific)
MDTPLIFTGDCREILPTLAAASVDLVFADPPFNIGLDYPGYDDSRPPAEYLAGLEAAFHQVRRVLRPTGSLFVAIGPRFQAEVWVMLKGLGFYFRNTIIWHYTFGPCQKRKFTPSWTGIHYFTRHPDRFTFNAATVKVPSARQLVYRDKRSKPGGKVPDDVWVLRPQDAEGLGFFDQGSDCWHVPRVAGTFKERQGHVCQMPLPVLERIIRVASNPGDLVLDPYAGTATTLVAALRLGRQALSIELDPGTADLARQRLAKEVQDRPLLVS